MIEMLQAAASLACALGVLVLIILAISIQGQPDRETAPEPTPDDTAKLREDLSRIVDAKVAKTLKTMQQRERARLEG